MAIVTTRMQSELEKLHRRFVYVPDNTRLDHWRIHRGDGEVRGDCEDFALTLLWQLSDQSMRRFWWNIITMRACFWHVKSYNGGGHAVLWYKGYWADNMEYTWYRTDQMRHTRRWPILAPIVLLKFALAKVA